MKQFLPYKVMDLEVSQPLADVTGLEEYELLVCVLWFHGYPVGFAKLRVRNGNVEAAALERAIRNHKGRIAEHRALLVRGKSDISEWPAVTVAVCTRDRPNDLRLCLVALGELDYPDTDVIVVDNAPTSDATECIVRQVLPGARYVREPKPGLDWARNRAIAESRGEIVAFTDDDVIVDRGWLRALVQPLLEDPAVMAVTGLVVPFELDTHAQTLFEAYGGFSRGFKKRRHGALRRSKRIAARYGNTGSFGTGANMAFRRALFDRIGSFDPALDVGTVTNGGGDLEMFFRVLKEGYALVYEPGALVRHRHRRTYPELREQITNWGTGMYSYVVRSVLAYPEERPAFVLLAGRLFFTWYVWRFLKSYLRPLFPRELILDEMRGALIGLRRYHTARENAGRIARSFDSLSPGAST
ncbi:MAG: glycosyltransferase family 2 protein [Gemmatimonadaceae bacterium]